MAVIGINTIENPLPGAPTTAMVPLCMQPQYPFGSGPAESHASGQPVESLVRGIATGALFLIEP
jgi:hypothetical protein